MGTTPVDSDEQYACRCLNIRIRTAATQTVAVELNANPDFTQLFVGEEGIIVAHPQLTVRTRTRGVPIAGTSRCSRFTTINCLLCDFLAYRVYQTYPADVEGKDGPLLPTEEWAERDVLKSSTGWIEVHKQCLTRNAVSQALLSPHYSAVFHVLLPYPYPISSPPLFDLTSEISPPRPHTPPSPSTSKSHFAQLRPVFLPPPFTPSHSVFAHLSSIAAKHSEAVRSAAEQHINDLIQSKVSDIEQADNELRRDVDRLWGKFREGLTLVQEQNKAASHGSSTSRSGDNSTTRTVRDFVPAAVSPAISLSPPVPRISALSASLATSSFHHPRARADPSRLPDRPSSPASNRSNGSTSSTLIYPPPQLSDGTNSNVLKFKRNINDSINTAASYRYFVNLEEDMARHREQEAQNAMMQETMDRNQEGSSSHIDGSPNGARGHGKQSSESRSDAEQADSHIQGQAEEASISRGREKLKGKRKVTFDVEPAVVTIKREVNAEIEDENDDSQDPREMIFELEDLGEEGDESSVDFKQSLPLVEQPVLPVRPRKHPHRKSVELSDSFSSLRPASLPAPSHIRPPKSSHGADTSSPAIILSLPRPSSPSKGTRSLLSPGSQSQDKYDSINLRDAEILKLVAANTPSHRGAWKPSSRAWQTFVRRQDSKDHAENGYIAEESEEETNVDGLDIGSAAFRHMSSSTDDVNYELNGGNTAFIGSLPIPIKLARHSQALSLASYRSQTAVPDRPVVGTAPPVRSTAALRKAAYAERDRSRSIDPGALDFEEEEAEEEVSYKVEEGALNQDGTADAGGRGRNRALRILQAGSEVPEAGMWRSLAT